MLIDGIQYFSKDNIENLPYKEISAAYNVESDDRLIVDTSSGSFNVTLPANPFSGQTVRFASPGTWATNNLIVRPNGKKIHGVVEDLLADIDVSFSLVYSSVSGDWRLY